MNKARVRPARGAIQAARQRWERVARDGLFALTGLPPLLVVIIAVVLAVRAWPILAQSSLWELLGGRVWKPMAGQFGFLPFLAGTLWVTAAALVFAVPPSLLTAIYLAEYARPVTRALMKPLLDLLAAIPSVVYGVWGVVAIVPWVQNTLAPFCERVLGFFSLFRSDNPTGFSIMAGALVLAVMITPFMIAVTYEVFRAVPDGMRQASLAVGATRWQTVRHVVLPKARAGVLAGIVLGLSRALGETMAVLMVVGNVVRVPRSLFDPAYPLPALIANNYGEMMSIPLYDSALMTAALILLAVVLTFNVASNLVLRRIQVRAL